MKFSPGAIAYPIRSGNPLRVMRYEGSFLVLYPNRYTDETGWLTRAEHDERTPIECKVPQKIYQCAKCGKRIGTAYGLQRHKCGATDRIPCDFCGQTFKNARSLQTHLSVRCGK